MAPQTKRKFSRSRHGNRRSHMALRLNSLSICPQCKSAKMPHQACPNCGTYNGRQVLNVETVQEQ